MFKKMIALSSLGLLALAGCGKVETQTFVTDTVTAPADDSDEQAAEFGQDYDEDGDVDTDDNALGSLVVTLQNPLIGIELQALLDTAVADGTLMVGADVTSNGFENDDKDAAVTGYLASLADAAAIPAYDGTDEIALANGDEFDFQDVAIANGRLTTGRSEFVFALPLDPANPTVVTLQNAILEGDVNAGAGTIANGKLSGTILATDFALALNGVGGLVDTLINDEAVAFAGGGAPIACTGDANRADAACGAGLCSTSDGATAGVCVDAGAGVLAILDFADGNGNGQLESTFDGQAFVDLDGDGNAADDNELSLLFHIEDPGAAPSGLIGGLFKLDLDGNTVNDAMGLGIGFTSVGAIRQ